MIYARPRVTVRRLMVAVAIVAALLWSVSVAMRWDEYRRLAAFHSQSCQALPPMIEAIREQARYERTHGMTGQPGLETDAANFEKLLARKVELERKYRRAMWRPWVPVDPDPPEPR